MMGDCPVNHGERKRLGLLGCYECRVELQSIAEANRYREKRGQEHFYGPDRVLRRVTRACPTCNGSGRVPVGLSKEGE
jgi:hypothetical protein